MEVAAVLISKDLSVATLKWQIVASIWERLLTFGIDPLRPTASGNQHHYDGPKGIATQPDLSAHLTDYFNKQQAVWSE